MSFPSSRFRMSYLRMRYYQPAICRIVCLTVLLLLGPGLLRSAHAQDDDTPTSGPPRFLLNPGGPVATVRALRFTPNSQRLLAGGGDKVVFTWGLHREAPDAPIRFTPNPPLHWEISRGQRGYIYAIAISPDGKQAAVGGFSAREASGDIWIFNLALGELTTVLRGHKRSICGLDFSPDGKNLASSSVDGDTRLWNVQDDWSSKSLFSATNHFADRPIAFLSNSQLAMALPVNANLSSWQIAIASVNGGATRKLSQSHQGRIAAIARDGNSERWASADRSGNVFLWNGSADQSPRNLRAGRTAAALAFAPNNRLFISTMRDTKGHAVLELWDTRSQQRLDEILLSEGEDSFACEVSPNGKYLATYASDTSDILVWDLTDDEGTALKKPLSAAGITRVRGSGRKTWHVAFDKADTYKLGIGQTLTNVAAWDAPRSKLSSAFDLQTRAPIALADHKTGWRSPTATVGAASLKRLDDGFRLEMNVEGAQGSIRLDREYQGQARCYCWLNDPTGKPYAVAVGTDFQCGVFVYGLPRNGKCEMLRYFRHHHGWVTSLSASTDGKYLASSAVDGTIKIWSLAELRQAGNGFSQRRAWGGTLVAKGENRLVVRDLNDAGILATRGLQVGDEIIGVQYIKDNQAARATTAREMLSALEANPLWNTVVVSVLRQGKGVTQRELFVPAWDPLLSLYLDRQGEWAAWTPQGYYDSSVAGDERFGWILNAAEFGRRPRFMRADRLRGDLERPDVLDQLLEAGNLPAALKMAGLPAGRKNSREQVTYLADRLPDVKIIRPLQDQSIEQGKKIVTTAKVEFPDGAKMENYRPSMFVNGISGGKPKQRVEGRVAYYEWETPPPNKYNAIRVSAERHTDRFDEAFSQDQVNVRAEVEPKKRKLHFIGLAASKYAGSLKLPFAVKDVEAVAQMLSEFSGEFYELESRLILVDQDITKQKIDRLIDMLRERENEISQEDLLVVYLAGHGVALSAYGDYYFVPPDPSITTLDEDQIRSKGISWDRLRGLADVPCRKVFMIDTCFQNNSRLLVKKGAAAHLKSAVRPLRRSEALVVTGCGLGESSYEVAAYEHGLFTHVVLEGLQGYADGMTSRAQSVPKKDETVELLELVSYILNRVPKLADQAGVRQQPTSSSSDLGFVPLIKY